MSVSLSYFTLFCSRSLHQIIFQELQKSLLFYHFINVGISLVRFRLALKNVKFYPSAYSPLPAFILVSRVGSNRYFYFIDKRVNISILHCLIYILLNCSPFMFICGDQKTCACLTLSPDFKNNFLKQKCKRGYPSNYHYK